jgi:hypothetical protein
VTSLPETSSSPSLKDALTGKLYFEPMSPASFSTRITPGATDYCFRLFETRACKPQAGFYTRRRSEPVEKNQCTTLA